MPNKAAPPTGSRYSGLWADKVNGKLALYHNGTKAIELNGSAVAYAGAQSPASIAATTTVQAGTHLLAPTGDVKLGTATAFASTQPVAAIVMGGTSKGATAPVGAIATCGGLFASDTVVRKIIADGTASNVET